VVDEPAALLPDHSFSPAQCDLLISTMRVEGVVRMDPLEETRQCYRPFASCTSPMPGDPSSRRNCPKVYRFFMRPSPLRNSRLPYCRSHHGSGGARSWLPESAPASLVTGSPLQPAHSLV
jgi:hypothetical protein